MTSYGCFHATSLDALLTLEEGPTTSLHGVIGRHDGGFGLAEIRADLEPALQQLSPRDRQILVRRVEDEWTQQQIADELAISQMQVSRVLAQIHSRLHDALQDTAVA
jgi:RNA polymerase sigma-B factor